MPERIADAAQPPRRADRRRCARELPEWRVAEPQGGISLWAELDAPLSTPLTMLAAPAGVIVVPGSRFGVDGTLERFLRIPFALPEDRLERPSPGWPPCGSSSTDGRGDAPARRRIAG